MNYWTVFRNQGRHVFIVTETEGELDVETGVRPKTYRYKRVLALLGSTKFGFALYLTVRKTVISLLEEADLVIIGSKAHRTSLEGSFDGVYAYSLDEVTGDELNSIMDGVPAESSHSAFPRH